MILIDTSVWVEFFRKSGDRRAKEEVARLLDLDQAVYTCPVYFELRAGARNGEIDVIDEAFSFCHREVFAGEHWEKAADLERVLRHRGITVPRDDLFVAALGLQANLEILCRDRHFDLIRQSGVSLRITQLA